MARPTTKKDLIELSNEKYQQLNSLINSISVKDQEKEFHFNIDKEKEAHWRRDKNLRDVLIHLYEWHQLLLNWVNSNMEGREQQFLIPPYNWKTYGEMNMIFFEKHKNTKYDTSRKILEESHLKVMNLLNQFSNEELFEKGKYQWTGGSTLGQYFVSTTSSHYDWAIKKLKKHIKSL